MCKWGTDQFVRLCKAKEISKKTKIKVDKCLAPLVQILNDYGIETITCCCGHDKTKFSYIRIHPKNLLFTIFDDTLTTHLQFPYKTRDVK